MKLINEIHAVLDGKYTIQEKLQKLAEIKTENRPGAKKCANMIALYRGRIAYKKQTIKDRLNSKNANTKKSIGDRFSRWAKNYPMAYEAFKKIGWPEDVANTDEARAEYSTRLRKVCGDYIQFKEDTGLSIPFYGQKKSVEECQKNKSVTGYQARKIYCEVQGHIFVVDHTETTDFNAYSKGYRFPKVTVDARWVAVYNGGKRVADIDLDSFQGNYLFKAIVGYLNIEKVKVPPSLKNVQLNEYYDVNLVRSLGSVQIYLRTFCGELVDFCAVSGGTTYHAPTQAKSIEGLRNKLASDKKIEEDMGKAVNAAYLHKRYGFCMTGMYVFACENGLDFNGEYTLAQIRDIVMMDKTYNKKYANELAKINIKV